MQRTLLLALFCVITISSQAQKINGKITDVKGESLPYSDIIVKDSLDNMVAYAIANAKENILPVSIHNAKPFGWKPVLWGMINKAKRLYCKQIKPYILN